MKKIAVIELDVRNCKLLLAEYNDDGLINVVDELIEPLKLWADVEMDNVIKPARTLEAISVLQCFRQHVEISKAENIVAYCSSAFKDIKNHRSFLEEINSVTSFKFEIINDDKLANCVHLLSANTMEQIKGYTINIQDDYIMMIKYNRRNVLESYKFGFGTLTLAKMFENEDTLSPAEKMEQMVEFARKEFAKCDMFNADDDDYKKIGMGNAFVNAGRLTRMGTKYSLNLDHNYELTIENFQKAYEVVKNLSVDKTKKIKGVSADRADTIASGFAIIKALIDCYCINQFNINELGVANGILYDEINHIFGEKPIGDILTQSLETCNAFYERPEYNCNNVFTYANDLFEELRVLHRYTKQQQRILKIACYLSNCGKRINTRNFERNSFSIVINSEIYGATHKEILLAGFVCASQNLDEFDFSSWVRYKDIIAEEDLEVVKKMAVFVKLARLIDKSKTVDHIVCDVLGDKCILSIVAKPNCQTVLDDIRKAIPDFRRAFDKQLQVL
ncbi:MAG: Ppx/GppA phosphatase family protein [Christensenellales bacterium]